MTSTQQTSPQASLFDRLGGDPAVRAAASGLVQRILADPDLVPYFDGIRPERHVRRLGTFVGAASGGSCPYRGPDIAAAHAHLGITDAHFDRVADHLATELAALGVDIEIAAELIALVASLRPKIVTA